jgi:hypothetical protein
VADFAVYGCTHLAAQGGFDLGPDEALMRWMERVGATPGWQRLTRCCTAEQVLTSDKTRASQLASTTASPGPNHDASNLVAEPTWVFHIDHSRVHGANPAAVTIWSASTSEELCLCDSVLCLVQAAAKMHAGIGGLSPTSGTHLCPTTNENGPRRGRKSLILMVGGAGFEPATPAV